MLIKNTIMAVNHGNITGNYTVLRDRLRLHWIPNRSPIVLTGIVMKSVSGHFRTESGATGCRRTNKTLVKRRRAQTRKSTVQEGAMVLPAPTR